MIIVCDSELSERAQALRKALFAMGYPCAAAAVTELRDYLPAKLIIAYFDVFNEIRHGPYDDIFVIVIGNGFVNSALHAIRVDTEEEACRAADEYLIGMLSFGGKPRFQHGILADPGIFLSKNHFEVYGNIVIPTSSEYMLFKYIYAFSGEKQYCTPEKIRTFCCVRKLEQGGNLESNIAVHIAHLNQKIAKACGYPLIRSRRYYGYYLDTKRI